MMNTFKVISILMLTLPFYSIAEQNVKREYVQFLKKTCDASQKDKVLREKARICNCFGKKMSKLTMGELKHLVLDSLDKAKYSELSIEDGEFIENYKLEVAYKCIGIEPPPGKAQ